MARLLLVDDDPDQLEIRKLLLEHVGHEVLSASSARQGAQVFAAQIELDRPARLQREREVAQRHRVMADRAATAVGPLDENDVDLRELRRHAHPARAARAAHR
jgi:hypothetical protein